MPESEAFCYSVGEKCGLAALFLRYAPDRFSSTNANTSCTIEVPASLRSENCSPSARNAVRVPPGISVRLQRNPQLAAELSPVIRAAVVPLLAEVEALNQRIAAYDRQLEQLAKEHHPEVDRLTHVKGCRDTDRAVDKPVGTNPYPRRTWW